ncbi:CAAX geranylgeranyltransferase alpha subunit [Gurleya vavrai]
MSVIENEEIQFPLKLRKDYEFDFMLLVYKTLKRENVITHQLFGVCSRLVELNIFNFDYWNTRTNIIKSLYGDFFWLKYKTKSLYMDEYEKMSLLPTEQYKLFKSIRKERKSDFIKMELSWICKCLKINYKNYQIWNYLFIFTDLVNLDVRSLKFIEETYNNDHRNVFFWTFMVKFLEKSKNYEYFDNFTRTVILTDKTNNSAFSLRHALIKMMYKTDKTIVKTEINFINYLLPAKKNQSLINYVFGLNEIEEIQNFIHQYYDLYACNYFIWKYVILSLSKKDKMMINLCEKKILGFINAKKCLKNDFVYDLYENYKNTLENNKKI